MALQTDTHLCGYMSRCPSYMAQSRVPAPSPFVCLTVWKCSCTWGSKLRTNFLLEAFDGRRRSLRSGGVYNSRASCQRGQKSDTQFTDRKYCYSAQCIVTRSIHIKAPVPFIQVGISRTQDHWSFHHGTLQRLGHSLGRYTCPVTTMPQQIYPTSNLAAEPSPEAAHW